jgi:hypothetical protein
MEIFTRLSNQTSTPCNLLPTSQGRETGECHQTDESVDLYACALRPILVDDSINDESKTIEKIDKRRESQTRQDKPRRGMRVATVTEMIGDGVGGGEGRVVSREMVVNRTIEGESDPECEERGIRSRHSLPLTWSLVSSPGRRQVKDEREGKKREKKKEGKGENEPPLGNARTRERGFARLRVGLLYATGIDY